MQATRLTLICHARTLAQKLARFPLDEPLDRDGQPLRGFIRLSRDAPTVVCGPELRTRQTAELFNPNPSLAPTIEPALRDCDFGRWKGLRINALQRDEPQALQAWLTDMSLAPHGGESVAQLCERVGQWLQSLEGHKGHVLAVTHPFVIRAALWQVMQAPAAAFNVIDVEPLSAVELRFNGRWRLRLPTQDVEEQMQ